MQTMLTADQIALVINSLRTTADRLWDKSVAHLSWSPKSAEIARAEAKELEKLALYFETKKGN